MHAGPFALVIPASALCRGDPDQGGSALRLLPVILATLLISVASAQAQHLGPLQHHVTTVFSGPCDGQSNHMADGTSIDGAGQLRRRGKHVDEHVLASSFLPLGTRIRFSRAVFGVRIWIVRDSGGAFDLYRPNCDYSGWPGLSNPMLYFRVIG